MMKWFQEKAPIRLKLRLAFVSMSVLIATMTILGSFASGWPVLAVGAALTLMSLYMGAVFRSAIADPYVSTVVRMEGLADGDLGSAIHFTHYQDCVGRISRAMLTFRDAAVSEKRNAQERAEVVQVIGSHLKALSGGDLTADVDADFPPAYAELKSNFNEALAALRALIGAVSQSAASINTGSGEIANASEDLARRTEVNAASLEETSASLSQIDDRLKASAVAASRTVESADQAIATVGGGRAIAAEAVQAMGRVSDSAKGIDSVIEGLDKIAFQTRVLAMNAAVEAGRAGEAGRGFAVVADLVSALAMRAEEEAGRARNQLTATQTDIVSAVEAVQKVDGAFADISGDVGQVHELLGTMALDNQAQSSAITQISTAIGTMDRATQQNAAMVEETSNAARSLTCEVSALNEQAKRFHIGHPAQGAPRAASAEVPRDADDRLRLLRPSSLKPLPSAAIAALVRKDEGDWKPF